MHTKLSQFRIWSPAAPLGALSRPVFNDVFIAYLSMRRPSCTTIISITFSIPKLWNKFSEKLKLFLKNWSTLFWFRVLQTKAQHFLTNLPYQKPMLRQIEWGVQNGSIKKHGLLPLTTSSFGNFSLSISISYK